MLHRVGAIASVFVLASCNQPRDPGSNSSANTGVAPALSTDLSEADRQSIIQQATEIVQNKSYDSFSGRHPCSDYWQVTNPRITDSMIGETEGKVMITFDLTVYNSDVFNKSGVGACFKAPSSGWVVGQPVGGRFEFNLEKWQSGWRVKA